MVRDHVDWWRSYYDYNPDRNRSLSIAWIRKHQAMAEWRSIRRWPRACRFLFGPFLVYASDMLHFETLDDDLTRLLDDVGAPRVELPIVNVSKQRSVMPDDVAEYIRSWYVLERQLLGYNGKE